VTTSIYGEKQELDFSGSEPKASRAWSRGMVGEGDGKQGIHLASRWKKEQQKEFLGYVLLSKWPFP
jgi:hypothetical protein